jgi:hypothetical protein
VVICPDRVSACDEDGCRRLDEAADLVRLEIETALGRGVRVIALFVRGAHMPKAGELPRSLAGLARRNGLTLRDEARDADVAVALARNPTRSAAFGERSPTASSRARRAAGRCGAPRCRWPRCSSSAGTHR